MVLRTDPIFLLTIQKQGSPDSFSVSPRPLPPGVYVGKVWRVVRRLAAVGLVVWCLSYFPGAFIIVLIVALFLFFYKGGEPPEKLARQDAVKIAEAKWEEVERRWKVEAGDAAFREKIREADGLKKRYENLDKEFSREKQKLQAAVRERQLLKFLANFFIHDHSIPQIGAGRKAILASYGIETAADIEPNKIIGIRGFGASLTNELVQWRRTLEGKFRFDPSRGVDPGDIAALDQKFRQERIRIEGSLLAIPEALNNIRRQILLKREALRPQVEEAAKALAQAWVDLSAFR